MNKVASNFDVIIIGAGPAGLSAAIWCSEMRLTSVVLEREPEVGGQLAHIYNEINNYPGCPAIDGRELRDRMLETTGKSEARFVKGADVIALSADGLSVEVRDGQRFTGRSIVFAAGVRRRRLDVRGESEFFGKGILRSGAKERDNVTNLTVAIVGGGDAALENSLILAEKAHRVLVIHRRAEFRARREFVSRAIEHPKIEFTRETEVTAINGNETLESLELKDLRSGANTTLPVDRVLIRIGVEPNSELLKGQVEMDEAGYVVVDRVGSTNVRSLYAVGDVANPVSPTIVTAVGSAASAVKHIVSQLIH